MCIRDSIGIDSPISIHPIGSRMLGLFGTRFLYARNSSSTTTPAADSARSPRSWPSAYDDCHASSPVWPGAVRASEDPSLGSIGEMAWASERPRPTNGYLAGRAGIQREDIFVGWGRAGRPQPADVLSQPGGMDELQAFLSLLAASTGTWAPESAIWCSGVVISTGTPSLTALETPTPISHICLLYTSPSPRDRQK